jgi:initiation factor 1A
MPKNLKGGYHKSRKNSDGIQKKREVETPLEEDNSHIAVITKRFGDSRYSCQVIDSNGLQPKTINVHLQSGKRKKFGNVNIGSHVLISFRDFEDKADIIFIYKDTEISYLINNGYIVAVNNNTTAVDISNNQSTFIETEDQGFDFSAV